MPQMNLSMKQNPGRREQTSVCQGGGKWRRGLDWKLGISRCKLVCIEWIITRSYCLALGAIFNILWQTIMEKNMEKNIYVCTNLSRSVVQQKLTKHVNQWYFNKKKERNPVPIKQPLPILQSLQPLAITNGRATLILSLWICLFRAFHTNKASIYFNTFYHVMLVPIKWKSLLKLFHSLPTALRIDFKFNAMVHRFLAKQVPACPCSHSVALSPPKIMHLQIEYSPLSSISNKPQPSFEHLE